MNKIILTAIGCPGGPSIIQALRDDPDIYIIGTDVREQMVSRYLVDEFYQVPPGKNDEFIPSMLDLVKKTGTNVILPLATFELLALSKHIDKFEALGCKVCVSDYDSLLVANDRSLLYRRFDALGFVPRHRILNSGQHLQTLATELGFPSSKVVVKPFISHGSIGLRIIDNEVDLFNQYRNHKPNNMTIPMDLAEMIFSNREFDDLLLSEYLPGKEFGIDMLVDPVSHEIITFIARDNGEVFHSEISNGKIIIDEDLFEIAKIVIANLPLSYTVNIDFKLDASGKPKILEINPRLPATCFLAYSAGINFPLYSIYLALGKEIPKISLQTDRRIFSYRGFFVVNDEGEIQNKAL